MRKHQQRIQSKVLKELITHAIVEEGFIFVPEEFRRMTNAITKAVFQYCLTGKKPIKSTQWKHQWAWLNQQEE